MPCFLLRRSFARRFFLARVPNLRELQRRLHHALRNFFVDAMNEGQGGERGCQVGCFAGASRLQ